MEDEINKYLGKNKHKYDDEFEQSRIVVDEVYEKIKALDTLDRDEKLVNMVPKLQETMGFNIQGIKSKRTSVGHDNNNLLVVKFSTLF